METDAVAGGKSVESHGFSRLDLVKHSINTMIEFMNDCDEIALVPFSNSAKILMNSTKMTVAGKNLAKQRVKELKANGSTNIWDGLKVALEVAKKLDSEKKNVFTVLLSDGEPNLNPPRGIVPTFKKWITIEKLVTPNVHVFGYGYELDTNLLVDIAHTGHGTYAYIPDCSMVGTVFVNFMANALSTVTNMAELDLSEISRELGQSKLVGFNPAPNSKYNLGCIQFGQERNVLLRIKNLKKDEGNSKIKLNYGGNFVHNETIELNDIGITKDEGKMNEMILRAGYLDLLQECLANGKKLDPSVESIRKFYDHVEKCEK